MNLNPRYEAHVVGIAILALLILFVFLGKAQ